MFQLVIWIEGIITKKWALVSLDLDKQLKRYDQKKFEYEDEQILKFENCKKIDLIGSLDRWDQDENLGVGFI